MEAINQSSSSNDYAVAKAFNEEVMAIIIMILVAYAAGAPDDYQIQELNRAYILLTNELHQLYEHNSELAAIKPEPVWKHFDVLKTSTRDINQYIEDPYYDVGQSHIARIERLCILSDVEIPSFSPAQKELLNDAIAIRKKYGKMLDDTVIADYRATKQADWCIPAYTLAYKPDGTILVNDVLKLKKAHAGSTTERLLEQALKRPNELFKPDLGQTSRNLSTILHGAGFTTTLRRLFFPTVSKSNGIVFRPLITREQADADKINTTELDLTLKELGAITEPKSSN